MNITKTVSRTLNSTLASIDDGEAATVEFARRAGFMDRALENIGLAVREIITNAVVHGNRQDPDKKILLTCSRTAEQLVIAISDHGKGFDPNGVPDPLSPVALLQGSGRGLYLARSLMDEFHVCSGGKCGTTIVLVKYGSGSARNN